MDRLAYLQTSRCIVFVAAPARTVTGTLSRTAAPVSKEREL